MEYISCKPDGWSFAGKLSKDCGYKDSLFPGCEYRLHSHHGPKLAVNITVTGKDKFINIHEGSPYFQCRCKIEFVGDGEPSTFTRGVLYHY